MESINPLAVLMMKPAPESPSHFPSSHKTANQRRKSQVSFLHVPAELRLQIYEHLFQMTSSRHPQSKIVRPKIPGLKLLKLETPAPKLQLGRISLLLTNRQVYYEALPVLYKYTSLDFEDRSILNGGRPFYQRKLGSNPQEIRHGYSAIAFLKELGPDRVGFLTSMKVDFLVPYKHLDLPPRPISDSEITKLHEKRMAILKSSYTEVVKEVLKFIADHGRGLKQLAICFEDVARRNGLDEDVVGTKMGISDILTRIQGLDRFEVTVMEEINLEGVENLARLMHVKEVVAKWESYFPDDFEPSRYGANIIFWAKRQGWRYWNRVFKKFL